MNVSSIQKYRPVYHYSPSEGWMNDPNGMVYFGGEYHLFYQYTAHRTTPDFANMHWGHAVSKDLLHWEELSVALKPDDNGAIFSGSVVVDQNNTTGFFGEAGSGLVAIYTNAGNKTIPGKDQVQSIAYSKDNGRTWSKYDGNPVLLPADTADFRDPKVFWYAPSSEWVMTLAVKDRVEFYKSPNLKEWSYASSFGAEAAGTHRGVYECPDLVQIPVDGDPSNKKWVLILSVGDRNGINENDPEPPAGGSGIMYFVGEFNGTTFTPDNQVTSADDLHWVDHGSDCYAAVTWSNMTTESGNPLWLGWMSNWRYANLTPIANWRGAMTIPRELALETRGGRATLVQRPAQELGQFEAPVVSLKEVTAAEAQSTLSALQLDSYVIRAEFDAKESLAFKVRTSTDQETVVGYDSRLKELYVDRTRSGQVEFHEDFTGRHAASVLEPTDGRLDLLVYVDRCSVEVFASGGQAVITDLIFPEPNAKGLGLLAEQGDLKLHSLEIDALTSEAR
ncbi:Levanase precursor [compost metagenome]